MEGLESSNGKSKSHSKARRQSHNDEEIEGFRDAEEQTEGEPVKKSKSKKKKSKRKSGEAAQELETQEAVENGVATLETEESPAATSSKKKKSKRKSKDAAQDAETQEFEENGVATSPLQMEESAAATSSMKKKSKKSKKIAEETGAQEAEESGVATPILEADESGTAASSKKKSKRKSKKAAETDAREAEENDIATPIPESEENAVATSSKKKKSKRKSKKATEETDTPEIEENGVATPILETDESVAAANIAQNRLSPAIEDISKSKSAEKAERKRKRAAKAAAAVPAEVSPVENEEDDLESVSLLNAQALKNAAVSSKSSSDNPRPNVAAHDEAIPEDLAQHPLKVKKAKKAKAKKHSNGHSSRSQEDDNDSTGVLSQPTTPAHVPHHSADKPEEDNLAASSQLEVSAGTAPNGSQKVESRRSSKKTPGKRKADEEHLEEEPKKKAKRVSDKRTPNGDLKETLQSEHQSAPLSSAERKDRRKRRLPVDDDEPGPSSVKSKKGKTRKSETSGTETPRTPKTNGKTQAMPATSTTPRGGRLSPETINAITQAVDNYRHFNGMTQYEINDLVQQPAQSPAGRELWKFLREEVPYLTGRHVLDFCRRKFHNYEARGIWTEEQDEELRRAYQKNPNKWTEIGREIHRFPEDARDRWRNYLVCGGNRRTDIWDKEEEEQLKIAVKECLQAIREERRRTTGSSAIDVDEETLLDWQKVSEKMNHVRSRLQCSYKWRKLKALNESDGEDPVANAPISNSWRFEDAQMSVQTMTAEEKLRLLRTIRDSGASKEGKIPWASIRHKMGEMGKRMAWKLCYRKLKEKLPGHEDMKFREIIERLVDIFEAAAPNEPEGFDIERFPIVRRIRSKSRGKGSSGEEVSTASKPRKSKRSKILSEEKVVDESSDDEGLANGQTGQDEMGADHADTDTGADKHEANGASEDISASEAAAEDEMEDVQNHETESVDRRDDHDLDEDHAVTTNSFDRAESVDLDTPLKVDRMPSAGSESDGADKDKSESIRSNGNERLDGNEDSDLDEDHDLDEDPEDHDLEEDHPITANGFDDTESMDLDAPQRDGYPESDIAADDEMDDAQDYENKSVDTDEVDGTTPKHHDRESVDLDTPVQGGRMATTSPKLEVTTEDEMVNTQGYKSPSVSVDTDEEDNAAPDRHDSESVDLDVPRQGNREKTYKKLATQHVYNYFGDASSDSGSDSSSDGSDSSIPAKMPRTVSVEL